MKALLLPLVKQAAISGFINKKAPFSHMSKFGLGLVALSGLFFVAALVFMMLSGYGWLLSQYAQPLAALIMAGFTVVIASTAALGGYFLLKKKQEPIMEPEKIMTMLSDATDLMGEDFVQPIKDNPKAAVLIASVVGLMVGERLH